MTKGVPPITPEDIRRVTQQVVEQFHPQKVILFGSYAYGQLTADSDVDLLVVMETNSFTKISAASLSETENAGEPFLDGDMDTIGGAMDIMNQELSR